MKKLIFILIAVMAFMVAEAQTETPINPPQNGAENMQTLFTHPGTMGWWVSPDFAWTQFDGKDAFLGGLSGGVIINHSFSMGLAGYGIMNSQNLHYTGKNDTTDVNLYGGYGGFKMEYRLFPLNKVNIAFPLLIGSGGVAYSTWDKHDWHENNDDFSQSYTWDGFFVFEPGVVVGINMLKFMRFDAGASYRYATAVELPRTNSDLLNGFNVNFSLKFGKF